MPNQLVLPITAGTLPGGSCPATGDYQGLLNLLAQYLSVIFPTTFSGLVASQTAPVDQTQVWLQLDATGRPQRLYVFAAGSWVSLHPLVPGFIMIWPFVVPDFTTFDGGDANAASATSGPMWQLAQDASGNQILQSQVPLGVGTLPQSGNAVAVGQTGGEELHSLLLGELTPHTHAIAFPEDGGNTGNPQGDTAWFSTIIGGNLTNFTSGSAGGNGATPPVVVGHNTLPPYYGVYFLQRTNRLYYSAS